MPTADSLIIFIAHTDFRGNEKESTGIFPRSFGRSIQHQTDEKNPSPHVSRISFRTQQTTECMENLNREVSTSRARHETFPINKSKCADVFSLADRTEIKKAP